MLESDQEMNFLGPNPQLNPLIVSLILLWTMFWKILALWRAAKDNQRYWFVGIFVSILFINTLGILEIIYLFKFAKTRLTLEDLKTTNLLPD